MLDARIFVPDYQEHDEYRSQADRDRETAAEQDPGNDCQRTHMIISNMVYLISFVQSAVMPNDPLIE